MDIVPTDSTADTEPAAPGPPPRPGRIVSMLAGFVSAATALAVAEALTVFARSWRSPVLDVGDRMVDIMASYPKVKQTAVDVLGNADKPALLLGIGVLLTIYSLILGWVALRRSLLVGELMVGLFAVIGVWAALGRASDGSLFSALPTVVGAIAGVLVLRFLDRALQPRPPGAGVPDAAADASTDRRRFIGHSVVLLGGVAAAAALVGVGGRQVATRRFSAAGSRKNVTIPTAEEPLGPVPSGAQAPVEGMTPFITPNGDFYRVDTALEVPQLTTDGYTLKVTGMVDNPMELSWSELLNRPMIERDITMTCVSNTVGGHYVGTARWIGARLDDLLGEAGVQPDADMVVGRSSDGFECGFPVSNAMDGRDAIIAVAMNGEPLPLQHGFPARLVVPGLYGFVSGTKWLTEIELTRFDQFEHYWERRGWAEKAPIKLMSRIDVPKGLAHVRGRHRRRRWCGVGPDHRHRQGRGAGRRRRLGRGDAGRPGHGGHVAAVVVRVGRHARATTPCACGRPTGPASCRPTSAPIRSPTAPPAGTRSWCSSTDGGGRPSASRPVVGR